MELHKISAVAPIRTPGIFVAVINRNLPQVAGKRCRQLTRRIHVAKKHIGNGVARFGATKPDVEDGRQIVIFPRQCQRATRKEHQNHWFSGLDQCFQQIALVVGDADVGAARGFAGHFSGFAKGGYYHVRFLGRGNGFGNHIGITAGIAVGGFAKNTDIAVQPGITVNVAAPGFEDGHVSSHVFDAFFQRNAFGKITRYAPGAGHVFLVVGQGADQGNGAFFSQGQGLFVVLQQNKRLASSLAGFSAVFGGKNFGFGAILITIAIRIGKKAQVIFGFQDAATSQIDLCLGDLLFFEGLAQCVDETFADHVHVIARSKCFGSYRLYIPDAMIHHFRYPGVIGNNKALELPLAAQQVGQQPIVGGSRNAVNFIERCHDGTCASIKGCFVRWEVFVVHAHLTHVGGVVIPSGFRGTI